jgi:hypothetical protein
MSINVESDFKEILNKMSAKKATNAIADFSFLSYTIIDEVYRDKSNSDLDLINATSSYFADNVVEQEEG